MRPLLSRAHEVHLLERGWLRTVRLLCVDAVDLFAEAERDEVRELAPDLVVRAGAAGRSRIARARAANSFFMCLWDDNIRLGSPQQ